MSLMLQSTQYLQLKSSIIQVFQQGGIKSDRELHKLQNETLTRKKQADLEEKINNVKLDQKKIYEKKSIMIPKFIDITVQYYALIEHNKILVRQDIQNYSGYKRQSYNEKKRPNPSEYEADEIDIYFLQHSIRKLKGNESQQELYKHIVVVQFERCIEILDRRENLKDLQTINQELSEFSPHDLELTYQHWQKKCRKFKRPLLRINWKAILIDDKYGKYDRLKKAFHQRDNPKHKQRRKANKMGVQQELSILSGLKKENYQALYLARLMRNREELKFLKFKLERSSNIDNNLKFQIKQKLNKISKLQQEASKLFATQAPQPQIQPSIKNPSIVRPQKPVQQLQPIQEIQPPVQVQQPPQIDFDLQCFMASIMSSLRKHGFSLQDFTSSKIDQLNQKIKNASSRQKILLSNSLKEVDMGLASKQLKIKSPNSIFLVKKQSIINPSENFIVKMAKEDIAKGHYDISNFTYDNVVNKEYQMQNNMYSHGRLTGYVKQNPFIYCSQSNLNFTDNFTETLKIICYQKIFRGIDMELIDQNPLDNTMYQQSIEKTAEQSLDSFSLNQKLKEFKKNKKRVQFILILYLCILQLKLTNQI